MDVTRKAMAKEISGREEDLAFNFNASTAVNAVLRSIRIAMGGKVLFPSLAYPMIKNALRYLYDTEDESLIEVPITFPTSNEAILAAMRTRSTPTPTCAWPVSVTSLRSQL